jgi:hypothetical protein
VKTGTAPCSHEKKAPDDGYVIVLFPAEAPSHALLVRIHRMPGAEAARTSGEMLRAVE